MSRSRQIHPARKPSTFQQIHKADRGRKRMFLESNYHLRCSVTHLTLPETPHFVLNADVGKPPLQVSLSQGAGGRRHVQCTFVKRFLASAPFKPAISLSFLPGF